MKRTTFLSLFALSLITSAMAGCGGGGGNGGGTVIPTPKSGKAVLKISTTGTPSAPMAGLGVTVVIPAGVTTALETDGSVAATAVEVTGDAAPGTILPPTYTPATASSKGSIHFAMASSRPAGFGAGEFATVTLKTSNSALTRADFAVTDLAPIGLTGRAVSGLTPDFTLTVQ